LPNLKIMNTILVIEDESDLLMELVDVLSYEGFNVIRSSNGKTGVELAMDQKPDLILCDIMLPDLDGYSVLERVSKDSSLILKPFLFITAKADQSSLRKGMEMGASDYIVKPFSKDQLLKAVNVQLNKFAMLSKNLNDLKNNLLLSLPHEFQTPLNIILGFSKLLKEGAQTASSEDIRQMSGFIHDSGMDLYEIVQKYLFYIEFQTKKDIVQKVQVDDFDIKIKQIARDIADKYNRKHDLTVAFNNVRLNIATGWFLYALREIIDNAFKFSVKGNKVRLRSTLSDNFLSIDISDQGIGFPPDAESLLNAFAQFNKDKGIQGGIGLGLFLAKEIISFHDGTISIDSIPGKGSVVYVKIPLTRTYDE